VFTRLCERLADDLQRKGYMGKTIGIKLKFEDFQTATRDNTIEVPINDAKSLRAAAGVALKRMPLEKRIRLLGVRVGHLSKA
jgi:DNA polymerase-4